MMFRKLTIFMLMLLLVFGLAACGGNGGDKNSSSESDHKTSQSDDSSQKTGESKKSQGSPTKGMVDEDKTVAIVNGEKVKGDQYNPVLQRVESQFQQQGQNPSDDKIYKQAKKQALDSVVGQTLILQDADKKGYKPSDKKVNQMYDQQMSKLTKQLGGKKKVNEILKQQHVTTDLLKENIADQLEWDMYLDKEVPVKVTDKEIKSAYQQYKSNTKKPEKLEKLKPAIKQQLEQQKQQPKLAEIVDQLKKKGDINIKI
jgi:antitoxin component HigA of HigAB toxin-antitoxin module